MMQNFNDELFFPATNPSLEYTPYGDRLVVKGLPPMARGNTTQRKNTSILLLASQTGDIETIRILMTDPEIILTSDANDALIFASCNNHFKIVEFLLQDPRTDPSYHDNHAIIIASRNGHEQIVELLLKDNRVNPSTDRNCAIRSASCNSHVGVVKLLLAYKRNVNTNCQVLQMFNDDVIDPGANDNEAIRIAAARGYFLVVEALMNDPRVDPSDKSNGALSAAIQHKHDHIIKLLLNDPEAKAKFEKS